MASRYDYHPFPTDGIYQGWCDVILEGGPIVHVNEEVESKNLVRVWDTHKALLEACRKTIYAGRRNDKDGCTPETIMLKSLAWKAMTDAIAKAEGKK